MVIVWHERPARESMGETPMPLSNTPSRNPLKQQVVTRRVTTAKKWSIQKIHSLGAKADDDNSQPSSESRIVTYRTVIR
jgi:hypothetical protein